MRIAVLGASGFIGQNLVEHLLTAGYETIPVYFTHPVVYPRAVSYEEFFKMEGEIDAVIFAAGNSKHNISNESLFEVVKMDSLYIQTVLDRFEISKAILISSAAVYYGYEGPVDETVCPKPTVNYGISKRFAEMIFEKESKKKQVQAIVLRVTHAFGKGERETRLFRSVARSISTGQPLKVHGRGESYISPVPVEFVCKVVEYFLNSPAATGVDYYNVGSFDQVRVIEIVERLKEKFNFQYVFDGEETQPVRFMTRTEKLSRLSIAFHDVLGSVVEYIQSILDQV